MRILLTANSDWYLFNFRSRLLVDLVAQGFDVCIACPDGPYRTQLQALDARWHALKIDRRGMNPVGEISLAIDIRRVLLRERPHIVHNFTLKAIVGGSIASLGLPIPAIVNSFEGLGYLFSSTALKARLARNVLTRLLALNARRKSIHTIVLNQSDARDFIRDGLAVPDRLTIMAGAGVDVGRFTPCAKTPLTFTILYASRLLYSKGVASLVEATELLHREGCPVRLRIAGAPDPGNPDSVKEADLARWRLLPYVELLGHRSDVDALLADASVLVLVSRYAEGVPTIIAEAGAAGIPVITSAQAGCREIIEDGVNGLLIPADRPAELADALRSLVDDSLLAQTMGSAGRRIVEDRFDRNLINRQMLDLYARLSQEAA